MKKTKISILFLFVISIAAYADTRDVELAVEDDELNKVYNQISNLLSSKSKIKLREAQRAWIKMRDADCEWAAVQKRDCLIQRTSNRALELKESYFMTNSGKFLSIEEQNDESVQKQETVDNKNYTDNTYIQLVKNGILKINKTITIGQAFDNWDECKNNKWEAFKSSNGVNVVQFTCQNDNIVIYEKLKSFLSNDERSKATYLDIIESSTGFQFTVNLDETFQVHSVSTSITWEDGSIYKEKKNILKEIKRVYENENSDIDLSSINESTALILNMSLITAKNLAKKR